MEIKVNQTSFNYGEGGLIGDATLSFSITNLLDGNSSEQFGSVKVPFEDYIENMDVDGQATLVKTKISNRIGDGSCAIRISGISYSYEATSSVQKYKVSFSLIDATDGNSVSFTETAIFTVEEFQQAAALKLQGIIDAIKQRLTDALAETEPVQP